MPESVPTSESVVSAARAAATLPAAAESCGTQAPTAPAAVRGPGALSWWETVRAVMRLELLIAWRRRDTAALLGLYALGVLGVAVPGVRGWLGPFSPDKLVYYLLAAVLMVVLVLWRPSREARMRQLYAALPVSRLDVLTARYLLLAAGWVTLFVGGTAVLLAVGGLSNDTVGRHLTYLFLFGVIAAVEPLLLAAYGGTTSLPVLALWGIAIGFCIEMPVVFGVLSALESMSQQVVLAGGLGLIAVLSAVGLGASWRTCCRIYLRQDH